MPTVLQGMFTYRQSQEGKNCSFSLARTVMVERVARIKELFQSIFGAVSLSA